MDTEDDIRAVLANAAGGPPMRLEAGDVIARGSRIRRLRKRWAVAGSSVATALVLAVAGFSAGHHGGEPTPVQPARPELSTVAPTPTTESPAPAPAPAESGQPQTEVRPGVPSASVVPSRRPSRTTSPPRPPSATGTPTKAPVATTSR